MSRTKRGLMTAVGGQLWPSDNLLLLRQLKLMVPGGDTLNSGEYWPDLAVAQKVCEMFGAEITSKTEAPEYDPDEMY